METPQGYYNHGSAQVCVICGETIPQFEKESKNAEKTKKGFVCWSCQNQKSPETLREYGLYDD